MHRKFQVCRHVGPQKGWWWMGEPGGLAKGGRRPWAESQGKERICRTPVFSSLVLRSLHLLYPECLLRGAVYAASQQTSLNRIRDLFCWDSKINSSLSSSGPLCLCSLSAKCPSCEAPSYPLQFGSGKIFFEGSFWPLTHLVDILWMNEGVKQDVRCGPLELCILGSQAPATHVFNILFTLLVKVLGSHLSPASPPRSGLPKWKGWFPCIPSALQSWGPGELYQLWTDLLDQQL